MRTAILFRAYDMDQSTLLHYSQLQKQCKHVHMLYDATDKQPVHTTLGMNFTEDDYRKSGYPLATLKQIDEMPSAPKSSQLIYYNPEISVLLFYKQNPGYDYYLSLESDVMFNGDWNTFLDAIAKDDSDLLGTYTTHGWERDPETLNFDVANKHKEIMFGPVQRYSNKMLETLHKEYKSGKHGFYEAVVPTIALINGLSVSNFGKATGRQFYHPFTMCGHYVPAWQDMIDMDKWKNHLFHPVKDEFYKNAEAA